MTPEIVEAILDGRQGEGVRLESLFERLPVEWAGQRQRLEPATWRKPAMVTTSVARPAQKARPMSG
jgi:hypothetical protein